MSDSKSVGKSDKDTVIFVTKDDHRFASRVNLPKPDETPGLILPSGEFNWMCPCVNEMATGPCGIEFREALQCYHKSTAEPKGSDCLEMMKMMQDCMEKHPLTFPKESLPTPEPNAVKNCQSKG